MAKTPEELALSLSQRTFDAQQQTETQLRERVTNVLSAASIVVPVAAVAVGKGPPSAAVPFSGAALAYLWCAFECCTALRAIVGLIAEIAATSVALVVTLLT